MITMVGAVNDSPHFAKKGVFMDQYTNYDREIDEAVSACDNALNYLHNADNYLSSAGNWGIVDLLGGGFISTVVKHSKMDDARRELTNAKYAVK